MYIDKMYIRHLLMQFLIIVIVLFI